MPISFSKLQARQMSSEDKAKQLAEITQNMKEILAHLLIRFSVQPVLKSFTRSIEESFASLTKVCLAQSSMESNEEYSKRYYLPALALRRPAEVNVTITCSPVLAIIVIKDEE